MIGKCPYSEHGICQVATRLANLPVVLGQSACTRCMRDIVPMSVNSITAAIAAKSQRDAGRVVDIDLLRMATGRHNKAGYLVERNIRKWLKRFGITPPTDCGCDGWVNKMNKWGLSGSLEHLDEIVDALQENLKTTYLSLIAIPVVTKPVIRRMVTKWLLSARS